MSRLQNSLEDYGVEPVPVHRQMGWLKIAFVLFGINICLPAFVLGSLVAQQATWQNALGSIFTASFILTLMGIGVGLVGNQTKLSLALSTQNSFGRHGRTLLSVLLMLTSLGWFAIQLEIFGQVIGSVSKILFADTFILPEWVLLVLSGLAMTGTALFGLKSIAKFSLWAVPALLIVLIAPLFMPGFDVSFTKALNHVPNTTASFGALVSSITGAMAVGVILLPDITRYAKSAKDTFWGIGLGMMIGFPVILILSAYFSMASSHKDLISLWLSFSQTWWTVVVFAAVVLATWTTNDNNIYSAALAFNSVLPKLAKWKLTLVCGALGTALAIFGLLQHFSQWLMLLALTIPPVGAVLILDFLFKKTNDLELVSVPSLSHFRWSAWLAWLLGVAVGVLSHFQIISLFDIPALNALLVTALAYRVLRPRFS